MKLLLLVVFILCVGNFSTNVESYKILGVFPCVSHSHFTLGFRLMKELADRGHEVVFINSHPQKKPIKNFRDVSVEEIKKPIQDVLNSLFDLNDFSYYDIMINGSLYGKMMTEATFKHKNIQDLIKSDEKFDLVILENFLNEAMAIFAYKFNCPQILIAPGPTTILNNYLFGNPAPSSYVPNMLSTYSSNMNFFERLENTFREIIGHLIVHFIMIPTQNAVLKEAFPDAPELTSILYNSSLMLVLSDSNLDEPVPLQQNIKQIGGYYILPPKPLPKDIQEFMDNSPEGVIVFSMGSNLRSTNFEPAKRKAILEAFSRIKQKVLWKFESDLPEKPDNVKILKWLPQADVLAHPNTVAFISHGGLLGTTEAMHYGVPILGIPVFWDQKTNIQAAVRKGVAVRVDLFSLENDFEAGLNEILNNPKYKHNAKERSSVMRDRPMKPLDEAIFWIEYVIRTKGAPHLRSAALDLRWYQLYHLDIFLFVGCIISLIIAVFYLILLKFSRFF